MMIERLLIFATPLENSYSQVGKLLDKFEEHRAISTKFAFQVKLSNYSNA